MSKLSDAVKATAGAGVRKTPSLQPIIPIKCEEGFPNIGYAMGKRYHIGVELHATTVLDHNITGDELSREIQKARRLIIEEVFGEFRNPLYRLKAALFERDHDKAGEIVEEILKQMFEAQP